jgi:uncharacterized ion transporter superfamily protein YfcC
VKYKTVQLFVAKSVYSLSVQAHIPVTVLVVPVVSFVIPVAAGLAQATLPLTLLSTCQSVHQLGTSFTVTAQV